MRWQEFAWLVALLILAGNSRGGDAGKKDLLAMEGTWAVVVHEADGKKSSDEENKKADMRLEIKDGKYKAYFGSEEATKGSLKLDTSKQPKEIDTIDEGAFPGVVMKGIYELKGDEMEVCFGPPGGERPKEFTAKAGTQHMLLGYKRVKK